jgi:glycosyltransferase involved in cell wall biosynthesis
MNEYNQNNELPDANDRSPQEREVPEAGTSQGVQPNQQAPLSPQEPPALTKKNKPLENRQRGYKQRRHYGHQPDGQQHRDGNKEISIVIPLYNEEQSLRELFDKIRNVLHRSGRFEVIFIDDGSTDGSMRVLHELRGRDRRVKIIRFRRNYGKSAALSVGFAKAEGDIVITMDADLQDDPNEIPNLVNEIKKGYDLVSGWKKKRRDPLSKTIPSRFFNFITSVITGIKIHDFNCGLKAYRNEVVKEVEIYGELHRYIPVLAHWLGYKVGELSVQHHQRKYGKTKFGFGRFWKGFLDLLTVIFTTRYMQRPLHLFGFWGLVFFLSGFIIDLYLVILKVTEGMALSNRPLFVGGILLIIVGVQFISIGLIGELITKTRRAPEKEYSIREFWK